MSRIQNELNDCLKRMQEGEDIETCLSDYPEEAEELRQLLTITGRVQVSSRQIHPSAEFINRTQKKLESTYQSQYDLRGTGNFRPSPFFRTLRGISFTTVVIMITLLGGSVILAKASENTMPGHLLYPLKIVMEEVRLSLTFSEDKKISKLTDFAETRAGEIVYAADIGDDTKLEASLVKIEDYLDEINIIFKTKVEIEGNGNSYYLSRIEGIIQSSSEKVRDTLLHIDEPPAAGQPAAENSIAGNIPGQQPASEIPDNQDLASGNQTACTESSVSQQTFSSPAAQADIPTGDITLPDAPAESSKPPETAITTDQPVPETGVDGDHQTPPEEIPSKKQEIIDRVDKAYEKTIKEIEKAKEEKNTNNGKDADAPDDTDKEKRNGNSEGKGQGQNNKKD